jgi:hypothetical protein
LKCFVKLFVGEDPNGRRCYRLCRIVEVGTAKQPYLLPQCFVKLFVGEDPNGRRCYRLCRIVEVGTAKQPYLLPQCFVKLFVGEDPNGRRCYRLCRIVEVGTAKQPYLLPPVKNQKPVATNKMLMLQFGANKKLFPLRLVSDAKPTQADITQYETAMKAARLHDDLVGKREAEGFFSYTYEGFLFYKSFEKTDHGDFHIPHYG